MVSFGKILIFALETLTDVLIMVEVDVSLGALGACVVTLFFNFINFELCP